MKAGIILFFLLGGIAAGYFFDDGLTLLFWFVAIMASVILDEPEMTEHPEHYTEDEEMCNVNYIVELNESERDAIMSALISKAVYWGKRKREAEEQRDSMMAGVYSTLDNKCMAVFAKVQKLAEDE